MVTTVKITAIPTVAGSTFTEHSKTGGGFEGAFNYELLKGSKGRNLRIMANVMAGDGIGRYLIGMGPQAVVAPISRGGTCTSGATGNCDLTISLVHSGGGILGTEFQPGAKTQFGLYYGGDYFQRNSFPDLTSSAVIKPIIGFGGAGSSNTANRSIQEATIDWTRTFWKNPQYGTVLLVTQASYVTRSPWFVALGAPKNAHLGMGYLSIRYVLP